MSKQDWKWLEDIEGRPTSKSSSYFIMSFAVHSPMMQVVREDDFNKLIACIKEMRESLKHIENPSWKSKDADTIARETLERCNDGEFK